VVALTYETIDPAARSHICEYRNACPCGPSTNLPSGLCKRRTVGVSYLSPQLRTFCHGSHSPTYSSAIVRIQRRAFPQQRLLMEKRGGPYKPTTYREVHTLVLQLPRASSRWAYAGRPRCPDLRRRNDWVIAELGILYAGAINVPCPSDHRAFRAEVQAFTRRMPRRHRVGTTGPQDQADRPRPPDLQKIIYLDNDGSISGDFVYFRDILERGRSSSNAGVKRWSPVAGGEGIGPCDDLLIRRARPPTPRASS